jgi:pentatricopeptide repeat protein
VWREAVRVFESMDDVAVKRDTVTYNAVVRACERGGQFEMAYDYMRASSAFAAPEGFAAYSAAEGYTAADG